MMAPSLMVSGLMVRERVMVRINALWDQSISATSNRIKGMERVKSNIQKRKNTKQCGNTKENGLKTNAMGLVQSSTQMETCILEIIWMANARAKDGWNIIVVVTSMANGRMIRNTDMELNKTLVEPFTLATS